MSTLDGIPPHLIQQALAMPSNAHANDALERALSASKASEPVGVRRQEKVAQTGTYAPRQPQKRREDGSSRYIREALTQIAVQEGTLRTMVAYGPPRTKKNHASRLSHRGKPSIVPSLPWMAWRDSVLDRDFFPARLPKGRYNCRALFYRDRDSGDAHGFYQGLADVLQECGVVEDDKWIVSWDGSLLLVDRACPRVEVSLTRIDP